MRFLSLHLTATLFMLACVWPVAAEQYLALRLPGDKKPGVYMRIENRELRMGTTAAKAKEAPVLWSRQPDSAVALDGRKAIIYTWEDIDLTSYMGGRAKIQIHLSIKQIAPADDQKEKTHPDIEAQSWGLMRARDKAGTMWAYRFHLAAPDYLHSNPEKPQVIRIPGPGPGKIEVDAVIKGYDAFIGARLMMDGVRVMSLQRGGTGGPVAFTDMQSLGARAVARLEVRDAAGKLVHRKVGHLGTFSYMWEGMPAYLLKLDRNGTYVAKINVDYPGGRIGGKSKFTIHGKEAEEE